MNRNNHVHVKFFALFREMVGMREDWAEVTPNLTVGALWEQYAARAKNPRVANIRAAFAVNQRLASPDTVLQPGDEVGFLPPVSGGAGRIRKTRAAKKTRAIKKPRRAPKRAPAKTRANSVTSQPLNLASLIEQVESPDAGAIVTFSGVVRNNSRGEATKFLEYEAYPEMAEATFEQIEDEIHARWQNIRVAMAHRVGRLDIGEASVLIAVSSPHRAEAFAACRYAIERIKAILPVWKKEFTSEKDYWVEGPVAGEKGEAEADKVVMESSQVDRLPS